MEYSWKASSKSAVVYLTSRRGDFKVLSGSIMAGMLPIHWLNICVVLELTQGYSSRCRAADGA